MKHLFLLVTAFFTFFSASVYAQKNKQLTNEDVQNFFTSTTYVVNTGDDMLQDAMLRTTAKASWKVTPLGVGEPDYSNPEHSFLIITKDKFEKDKSHQEYTFVALLQGRKKAKTIADLPWIVSLPLSCESDESSLDNDMMITVMVAAIQNHVELIKENPKLAQQSLSKLYNGNVSDMISKTIYMLEEDLSPGVNRDKLVERFGGNLVLTDADELEMHVEQKTPNAIVALATKGSFCYKMLVGTENGKIYYYNRSKVVNLLSPAGFLQTDISRLVVPFKE